MVNLAKLHLDSLILQQDLLLRIQEIPLIKQEFYRWFLHVVRRFLPLGGEIFRFNLKMTEEAATSSSASDI